MTPKNFESKLSKKILDLNEDIFPIGYLTFYAATGNMKTQIK